ncbi:MAG TPA: imidazolonepropionase [Candidatus Eisenbacteria bacterium]|nr:imidazolonepropionase [Candidatus Eisenbacteria bacterium]
MSVDLLVTGIGDLCRMGEGSGPQCGAAQGEVGAVGDAALAIRDGVVVASGSREEVARTAGNAARIVDVGGRTVLPGWVDAHTHLLFAGTREDEFALRVAGVSYEEIARQGGGIHASVRRFREASDETILATARKNLDLALSLGTTTIEVKTGYGLDTEEELRALRLIRVLREEHALDIVSTFLGAHEIPSEWRDDRSGYLRAIVDDMLPQVAKDGLAEFCDVFCERGVFTPEESRIILERARALGLGLKLHADEFGDTGGGRLAAALGVTSADHLHGTVAEIVPELARSGVVAVLLPGTAFFLGLTRQAPARAMIEAGVPVAVASDMNPGSSMSQSMPLMTTLACVNLHLTPEEALVAATVNGAAALGRAARIGRLRPGYRADFQLLDLPGHRLLPYHYGVSHVRAVFRAGRQVWGDPLPSSRS